LMMGNSGGLTIMGLPGLLFVIYGLTRLLRKSQYPSAK
jgi:hypothetical protein